jgi:aconitate hydratase
MTGAPGSYRSLARLDLAGTSYRVHRLDAVPGADVLPLGHKILLENLLRHEDGHAVTARQIDDLVRGRAGAMIAFHPSRVFLHDTNGVPVLTDLAALRDALAEAGDDPDRVSPRVRSELTVDHSIASEFAGRPDALVANIELEYARNAERYRFLKWGQRLPGMRVVPPGSGIMHQINLEYLAGVVERRDGWAFPDTCAGTDSHTTMVNGLGVLAWGVGGIEAEAALLGQPLGLVVPQVVGVELTGELGPGVTATDLVLTVTERLRAHGVVGRFVEFTGDAVARLPLAHRATVANMCPEYGATTAMFPIDAVTLDYLRLSGRPADAVTAVETYAKEQGLWHEPGRAVRYDEVLRIDLTEITASLAGPRRPQDRVPLTEAAQRAGAAVRELTAARTEPPAGDIPDGAVAIAAITSCTNTSNPHAVVAAGLLARNARARGLESRSWVKTSLAPGSRTVTDYLARAGLTGPLDELGFQLVGYGCMTCIGNSGPLKPEVTAAVTERGVPVAAVLSGNRNFDGRINNDVALNYLASPPLVVAYALAGTITHDLLTEPLGVGPDGEPVLLADLWPDDAEVDAVVRAHVGTELFQAAYADLFAGDERWAAVPESTGSRFDWPAESTYLRRPPFLDGVPDQAPGSVDLHGARVLAVLGDSVTTDHLSPAGRIPAGSVAGRHLIELGETDLNTYASRRGNFEVMLRGAFTNPRLHNGLVPGAAGGSTRDFTRDGQVVDIYAAAGRYAAAGVPLVVLAGFEYGTGSSRDWAAKGTALLGVRVVLARSFERIHRSNLVQLGVLPLQFRPGEHAGSLGLDGTETYEVLGVAEAAAAAGQPDTCVTVRAGRTDGSVVEFPALSRLDTPLDATHHGHGGILPFIYRQLRGGAL